MSPSTLSSDVTRQPSHEADVHNDVGVFHPGLAGARNAYMKKWLICLAATTFAIFAFLSIYWGSVFDQEQDLYLLNIAIIDLDTPASSARGVQGVLGKALVDFVNKPLPSGVYSLGYQVIDSTQFDISSGTGGPQRGVDAFAWASKKVLDETWYGVIIANANATISALQYFSDVTSGNSTGQYSGSNALSAVYAEARNFETVDAWIIPGFLALASSVTPVAAASLAAQFSKDVASLSTTSFAAVNKSALAKVVASPFALTQFNLRPFNTFAGIPATTIGMLYLLILTFFFTAAFNGTRQPLEKKLKVGHLIAIRILVPALAYAFISLSVSLMALAFGVQFSNYYGKGGFVLFWLMNWLTTCALGVGMESAISLLGPFVGIFLAGFAILNVSVAFIDLKDQSSLYRYAYVTPVYNAVLVAKSVAYGTKDTLGRSFGINFALLAVGIVLLSAVVSYQRRSTVRLLTAQLRAKRDKQT